MEILLEKYKKTRSEILFLLKQINSIVAFTPIGCAEMLCETFGFCFYNSNTMSSGFRKEYEVYD
jgi:hypothetical protein